MFPIGLPSTSAADCYLQGGHAPRPLAFPQQASPAFSPSFDEAAEEYQSIAVPPSLGESRPGGESLPRLVLLTPRLELCYYDGTNHVASVSSVSWSIAEKNQTQVGKHVRVRALR